MYLETLIQLFIHTVYLVHTISSLTLLRSDNRHVLVLSMAALVKNKVIVILLVINGLVTQCVIFCLRVVLLLNLVRKCTSFVPYRHVMYC